jgi:hypothetical protein
LYLFKVVWTSIQALGRVELAICHVFVCVLPAVRRSGCQCPGPIIH